MIIKNKYEVIEKIGEGGFGNVYKGVKMKNQEPIAIKINKLDVNVLKQECTLMHYLYCHKCCAVPEIYYYGLVENYYVCVMKYCEYNIRDFIYSHYKDNVISTIFYQCIDLLRDFHENMVVHGDIKPHNIMIHNNKIYFIDFGLSTFYMDDNGYVENKQHRQITGSPKYVSHFIHLGNTYYPRDDIISLCFVFLEFIHELPWNTEDFVNDVNGDKNKELLNLKMRLAHFETDNETAKKILSILNYCYSLKYNSIIDYDLLAL